VALVVEDEFFIRMEIAEALSDAGWRVVEFANGEALADHLAGEGGANGVSLIVTDIRLGGRLSGWEVAERCRAAHPEVAVIYCSGNSCEQARCVIGSVFLTKPCAMELLTDTAKRLCPGAALH
jgi:DNA-binding response OmpR family regulator